MGPDSGVEDGVGQGLGLTCLREARQLAEAKVCRGPGAGRPVILRLVTRPERIDPAPAPRLALLLLRRPKPSQTHSKYFATATSDF